MTGNVIVRFRDIKGKFTIFLFSQRVDNFIFLLKDQYEAELYVVNVVKNNSKGLTLYSECFPPYTVEYA